MTTMKKILVVENSPTIISAADSLLRQRGYDVTCLSDGTKALEFAKAEKPDLILTALGLEGSNGIQLCEKISSDPLTGGIPVVLLIGEKDGIYLDKIDLCGARGRIKKPFSPKELLSVVEKFTDPDSSRPVTKIVDQTAKGAPKLKPRVAPQEIGTATRNIIGSSDAKPEGGDKHETVFNLDWEDLKGASKDETDSTGKSALDDSGLILEEDQYGLTNLADVGGKTPAEAGKEEDYNWFIDEMQKEIDAPANKGNTVESVPSEKGKTGYHDLEIPSSDTDDKYRRFLDQFKKDTSVLTKDQSPEGARNDVNWLVEEITEKLAQKIVEKLDKQELKRILISILGTGK